MKSRSLATSSLCCEVVAMAKPRSLVLVGHGENSIFDIDGELRRAFPSLELKSVIADIRDGARIRELFEDARPSVVFHAAAHKHVPLMEANPEEAVTNNIIGTARLLFVGGMDRLLPPALARVHPRWNTPYVALLVQGALAALFIVAANMGASVHSAYLILVDATAILTFIPYLYLFAAAIKLRPRIAQTPEAIAVPGGTAGSMLANGIGFVTTLAAMALALVPPSDTAGRAEFFVKIVGGTALFIVAGLMLYRMAKRRTSD